jgi:hypothetical protein
MKTTGNTISGQERIRDLGLVAALVTAGFTVKTTETDGQRVYFIFDGTPQIQAAIDGYWANTLIVSARQYSDTTRMLKSRIYNGVGS